MCWKLQLCPLHFSDAENTDIIWSCNLQLCSGAQETTTSGGAVTSSSLLTYGHLISLDASLQGLFAGFRLFRRSLALMVFLAFQGMESQGSSMLCNCSAPHCYPVPMVSMTCSCFWLPHMPKSGCYITNDVLAFLTWSLKKFMPGFTSPQSDLSTLSNWCLILTSALCSEVMSFLQVLLAGSFAIIWNSYLSSSLSVWDDLATGYSKNKAWGLCNFTSPRKCFCFF